MTATQTPVDSGKTQLAAEAIAETASAVSTILHLALEFALRMAIAFPRGFQPHSLVCSLQENLQASLYCHHLPISIPQQASHSRSMVGTSKLSRVFFAGPRELLRCALQDIAIICPPARGKVQFISASGLALSCLALVTAKCPRYIESVRLAPPH